MVKVLHIIDRPGNGGAEKMFAETVALLERRGKTENRGLFLSSVWDGHSFGKRLPLRILRAVAGFPALVSAIRKEDPDVIYAYHPSLCIFAASAAGKVLGRKIVLRRFGKEDALPFFSRLADRISYALCDRVVALSADSVGELRRLGVPLRKISCIPNGKSPADYKSPSERASARKALGVSGFVFGMAARITPIKGQEAAIRALARITGRNRDARLVIVGEADDEAYMSHISRLIKESGLDGKVSMPGYRKDMGKVLAAFDAFVHASSTDGCPGAVLEAMCAELPIIAFDQGPLGEVLGDSAILVKPRDEAALASAMERLMNDTALMRSLGEGAGRRVAANFSADAMASRYEELFTELAAGP